MRKGVGEEGAPRRALLLLLAKVLEPFVGQATWKFFTFERSGLHGGAYIFSVRVVPSIRHKRQINFFGQNPTYYNA